MKTQKAQPIKYAVDLYSAEKGKIDGTGFFTIKEAKRWVRYMSENNVFTACFCLWNPAREVFILHSLYFCSQGRLYLKKKFNS